MMISSSSRMNPQQQSSEEVEEMRLRRGPWTVEEDLTLINYITEHGEGRWNSLARSAGLKRTGKSCRLRWLNYLRPDVRRGNITLEEHLVILQLHTRWGNRWSKIAQQLPGRTDNEIKNYWRTRVQKQAKQLRCDADSRKFRDLIRRLWMPRLLERIRHSPPSCDSTAAQSTLDARAPTSATVTAAEIMKQQQLLQTDEESDIDRRTNDAWWSPSEQQEEDHSSIENRSSLPSSSDSDSFNEYCHSNILQAAGFAGWTDHEPFTQALDDDHRYYSSRANLQIKDELIGGDLSESFWIFENIWSMQ